MPDTTARLIIAASEQDANLYYATRFLAPDPFVFLQINGRTMLLMSDLEVDRARQQARVDEVLSVSKLQAELRRSSSMLRSSEGAKENAGAAEPTTVDLVDAVLKRHAVHRVEVPATFGVAYADRLRQRGYEVLPKPDPFFETRLIKSEEEIGWIEEALRATEEAVECAINVIRESDIAANGALIVRGQPLTAETIKRVLSVKLLERGCIARHSIVACGLQGCDPHNEGSGPLQAHQPIILDVFPQSENSRYYADLTRTVVRGAASDAIKRMYDAVAEGQEIAFRRIRDGADGKAIHAAIMRRFEELGFRTGEQGGRMQGFFHGTGHGVGLDIHEPPRISSGGQVLRAGEVVTVEPGLYYTDAGGGVRLEDMVVVTADGCRNLTRIPKVLEI